ncbi:MAG: efflux RND transporter periplasmic adaptor subunit [Pyrinomonadaceae bacterium]|jgi:RND family efflux transporter MFP subunit|nr:efflux RND transporter periplasmic adaptor subunit [Pyrinomonadaceae bacterium]
MNNTTEEKPERDPAAPDSGVTVKSGSEKVITRPTNRRTNRTAIVAVVAVVAITAVLILVWVFWRSGSGGAGRPVPAPRNMGAEQPSSTASSTEDATISLEPEAMTRAGIKTEPVGEALVAGGVMGGQATTGVVQANAYRTTPVVSLVGGILRQVTAELGESVSRGQTMAIVFSDDVAMAQSRYLNAVAELDERHKHHVRTVRLVEIGAASREELEQATTKVKTAESEVASQRQRLMLLGLSSRRIAQLKSSSQVNSEVSLPAPVSGTVITRAANPGEVITADKEILRIADLSSVWVMGQIYEKDLGKVVVGSGASITSDAYPERVFRGRVSYIDPTLDPATRTAQARIELANPRQALKIGMFVNVAFAAPGLAESTTPVIPKNALQNLNNQQVVFVETKDANVFAMRPVKLGSEVNGRYPVLEGLTVGERIVTEGSFLLRAEWLKRHPGRS